MTPDLLIVGAGPAGTSGALWARTLGLSTLVLESGPAAGGQLHQIHFRPENFAGAVTGNGPEVAAAFGEQLAAAGVEVRYGVAATGLDPAAPAVLVGGGERLTAHAVLVATGVRRRRLEVPGERECEGRGVSWSATQDRARFAGEEVVVAGGGDAAFENALLLAEVGCRVTLAVRHAPRARPEFLRRVAAERRIEVLQGTRVTEVLGDERMRSVRLSGARGEFELPAAGLIVKIGVIPNTDWCAGTLEVDAEGYIQVDDQFGTSRPRVWAAGDVTRPPLAGIAVALGQGALAASAVRAMLRDH